MLPHPGIIVMVADNDAGGITTYTATGAQFDFHPIWFLILLGPVAYNVQETTVRLGAVTKRNHAEAIFHALLGGLAERLRAPFVEVRRPVGWITQSK